MTFSDEETARQIYTILEAVGWKWTISEILEQPDDLLMDVLQMAALRAGIKKTK